MSNDADFGVRIDNQAVEAHAAPIARPRIRSIVGGLAGNLIEWYDFLAYSIFRSTSRSRFSRATSRPFSS